MLYAPKMPAACRAPSDRRNGPKPDDFNVVTHTIEMIKPAGQEKTPPGIFHLANKWGDPLALN
jgi:hypothetical protein